MKHRKGEIQRKSNEKGCQKMLLKEKTKNDRPSKRTISRRGQQIEYGYL